MHESDPMSVLGIGCQSIWLLSHIAREDLHDSMPFVMINTPTSSFPADTTACWLVMTMQRRNMHMRERERVTVNPNLFT